MPRFSENNVPVRLCPHCGKKRPHDWFSPADEDCWKCRALRPIPKPEPKKSDIEAIKRNIRNSKRKGR